MKKAQCINKIKGKVKDTYRNQEDRCVHNKRPGAGVKEDYGKQNERLKDLKYPMYM